MAFADTPAQSSVNRIPLPDVDPTFRPASSSVPSVPLKPANGVTVIEHKHTNDLRDTGLKDFLANLNAALERTKVHAA